MFRMVYREDGDNQEIKRQPSLKCISTTYIISQKRPGTVLTLFPVYFTHVSRLPSM